MKKWVLFGALIGFIAGFVLKLIFPSLLSFEVEHQKELSQQTGNPEYIFTGGSYWVGSGIVSILGALLGMGSGWILYKLFLLIKK